MLLETEMRREIRFKTRFSIGGHELKNIVALYFAYVPSKEHCHAIVRNTNEMIKTVARSIEHS